MVEIDDMAQSDEWDEEPVNDVPEVIEPGEFTLTVWGRGSGGEPVMNCVWFTWAGGREAEWCQDISPDNAGMYQWASSPVRGTAVWPNGRDVELTYSSTDFGILEGDGLLSGAAPISGDPSAGGDTRDPRRWVRFAAELDDFVAALLGE